MDGQSYKLATKCSKGVKMGQIALENMAKFCDGEVREVMLGYVEKHKDLANEIDDEIRAQGREVKGAGKIASWFAVKGIEFRFAGKHDPEKVVRSAISGADKAIRTLERDASTYSLAKPEICDFVRRIIGLEQDFKKDVSEAQRNS